MALYTFRLPDIGEGIAEAEIVAWHVAVGDRIEEDGKLADMMTDKATVEMESPVAGTVQEVAGEVGQQIAIGSVLVVIETSNAVGAGASKQSENISMLLGTSGVGTAEAALGDGAAPVTAAMAAAEAKMTHTGMPALALRCPETTSVRAMTPIVFCASCVPCPKAMVAAEAICAQRKPRLARTALTFRNTQSTASMNR